MSKYNKLQKNYEEVHFDYPKEKLNIKYKNKFLEKEKADKYYKILSRRLNYNEDSKVFVGGKLQDIPRQQVAYGNPGTFYEFSGTKVLAKSWIINNSDDKNEQLVKKIILNIKEKVEEYTKKTFNFVLINSYEDGNQYIGYHKDDERNLVKDPDIVGVSLGAERDIQFKADETLNLEELSKIIEINLAHNSIICMNYPTNKYWKHSIPKRKKIKTQRISLTFRNMSV